MAPRVTVVDERVFVLFLFIGQCRGIDALGLGCQASRAPVLCSRFTQYLLLLQIYMFIHLEFAQYVKHFFLFSCEPHCAAVPTLIAVLMHV